MSEMSEYFAEHMADEEGQAELGQFVSRMLIVLGPEQLVWPIAEIANYIARGGNEEERGQ